MKLSQEEWAAQQKEALEALHETITHAVGEITTGEDWARMLQTSAKFHRYSFNNQLLIAQQTQGLATLPASFTTWKQLGRFVKKGEKGIKILAPVTKTFYYDKRTGNEITAAEAKKRPPSTVTKATKLVNVKIAHVFDISQTDGEPVQTVPRPQLLDGQAPEGLIDSLTSIIANAGFRLEYVPPQALRGANGVTRFDDKLVQIRNDVTDAQTAKTLIHETAHMKMHGAIADRSTVAFHRGKAEIEAESTAFLVASAHGLDTSEYTFPYVAGWSGGDLELVKSTAENVVKHSQEILEVTQPQREIDIDTMIALRKQGEDMLARAQETQTGTGAKAPQKAQDVLNKITAKTSTLRELSTLNVLDKSLAKALQVR